MRRIRILGLCLVAVLSLSALAVASASAAPKWYIPKKGGGVEVAKSTTKVSFSGTGAESKLEGGLKITCTSDTVKGDTLGEAGVTKVKIVYKGCHETGQTPEVPCGGTKKEIKTEGVKGTLTEASETVSGSLTVVEKLSPEKTLFTKFKCGAAKHEFPVTVAGAIFVRVSPVYAAPPTEAQLSTAGETFTEEKAVISGCGGQKFLYELGKAPCEHLKVTDNGTELEPSWNTSNDHLTFKSKVAIGA